ncbi:unnamed protein product [Effrenium voratum]|nr:unnamed protein product [Effrenium voratum]
MHGWCVAFLLELALRVLADGQAFLSTTNPEFAWNLTDTFFVAMSTADELIFLLGGSVVAESLLSFASFPAVPAAMARGLLDAFRKPDFNVAAFVRDAGQGQDTLRLSQQLQEAALQLEEDLRREIATCHAELLQSASSINDLDGQLGEAQQIVATLKANAARLRSDLLVPFQDVKHKVELLERMQAVPLR